MPKDMDSNRRYHEERRLHEQALPAGILERRNRPERRLPEVEVLELDAVSDDHAAYFAKH